MHEPMLMIFCGKTLITFLTIHPANSLAISSNTGRRLLSIYHIKKSYMIVGTLYTRLESFGSDYRRCLGQLGYRTKNYTVNHLCISQLVACKSGLVLTIVM